jgi:DNA polymerase lambda
MLTLLSALLQIVEILQTGDLRRIGYEKTEDVEITRLFQGIYGVGKAASLAEMCARPP